MDTIIGLGSVGTRIANEFGKKPQYSIITIDHDEDATILWDKGYTMYLDEVEAVGVK